MSGNYHKYRCLAIAVLSMALLGGGICQLCPQSVGLGSMEKTQEAGMEKMLPVEAVQSEPLPAALSSEQLPGPVSAVGTAMVPAAQAVKDKAAAAPLVVKVSEQKSEPLPSQSAVPAKDVTALSAQPLLQSLKRKGTQPGTYKVSEVDDGIVLETPAMVSGPAEACPAEKKHPQEQLPQDIPLTKK